MRLHLILPRVEPTDVKVPSVCPVCGGRHLRLRQEVDKPLRDTVYPRVKAYRYECLKRNGTHRVYPAGVSRSHASKRVKGLAVLLYLLGLSYGAVSLTADSFKKVADNQGLMHQVCKSHVKRNTDALIENLKPLAAADRDGSLAAIGVSPEQAVADLERLGELIRSRQPQQENEWVRCISAM